MNANPRILVIDDDPVFRSFLAGVLRRDHLVAVANDGAEGFSKAKSFPPQLVILDMIMPGWNGLTTLKAFSNHEALSRIPVMMITSEASLASVTACVEAGARDYLLKTSLSKQELLRHVRTALRSTPRGMPAPDSKDGVLNDDQGASRIAQEWDE